MKKIICLVAAAVLSATAFCAEHTLGLGLSFPISSLKAKLKGDVAEEWEDDLSQTAVGVDLTYLCVLDNAVSIKLDLGFDNISSNDVPDDPDWHYDFIFDIGAGYTFPINEKFTLSTLGMLGINYGGYDWTYEINNKDYSFFITIFTFDIGADVIGKYKFTDHFGVFANLGLRYSINLASNYNDEGDFETSGFRFIPTLGASWTF